jgi:hypothetical protein
MKKFTRCFLALLILVAIGGCRTEVQTTEDSTRVEAEGPKVEVGDKPVDLDPSTDADVDVDTPKPGDT